MHIARAALRGFGVAAPTTQRDPLPWEALVLIATFLASLTDPLALDVARALVVAFDGYLRPSEALGLRGQDVTVRHQAQKALESRRECAPLRKSRTTSEAGCPDSACGAFEDQGEVPLAPVSVGRGGRERCREEGSTIETSLRQHG